MEAEARMRAWYEATKAEEARNQDQSADWSAAADLENAFRVLYTDPQARGISVRPSQYLRSVMLVKL
ncbi:hypothetical protein E2562_024050 [Oryza meyeriana var. granulata]|uniref:Uncharacterized protein n=1 Tax=Oryza meyeriana var. granulata TaxID=110450 RepID=A0A6G1CSM2_9ORYZ|nr:hypothetical protein E2562_024050 [Oryza meyeriana var. granulata]